MSSFALLTQNEWCKVVQICVNNNTFDVLSCNIKPLGNGAGFFGEHRLAEVVIRLHDAKETERVLHFFIKTRPQRLLEQRDIVEQTKAYKKEVDALSKLFVQLKSVLEGDRGMEWTCKCFYANSEVIVLEDLTVHGFQTISGEIDFRYEHCAAVFKAAANLHAASLIFEEAQPIQPYRLGKEYPDILEECFFKHAPNHPGTEWIKTTIECIWQVTKEILGDKVNLSQKSLLEKELNDLFELVKPSQTFRNTVSHGDLWRNNIFFRGGENDTLEARLVDFQFVRYAPPANDLSCFLHITTSRSFREQYTSPLLSCYYDQLSRNLRRYGLNPERILSRQELEESYEFYRKLGVIVAPCYLTIIALNEEDINSMFASSEDFQRFVRRDRTPEVMHSFKCDSSYREIVTESIKELLDECVFNNT